MRRLLRAGNARGWCFLGSKSHATNGGRFRIGIIGEDPCPGSATRTLNCSYLDLLRRHTAGIERGASLRAIVRATFCMRRCTGRVSRTSLRRGTGMMACNSKMYTSPPWCVAHRPRTNRCLPKLRIATPIWNVSFRFCGRELSWRLVVSRWLDICAP